MLFLIRNTIYRCCTKSLKLRLSFSSSSNYLMQNAHVIFFTSAFSTVNLIHIPLGSTSLIQLLAVFSFTAIIIVINTCVHSQLPTTLSLYCITTYLQRYSESHSICNHTVAVCIYVHVHRK